MYSFGKAIYPLLACLAISFATSPARAQENSIAVALGEVLGSEAFCSLKYRLSAIKDFMDKNVDKNDVEFDQTLRMVTGWTHYQGSTMSPSARADRCADIEQVARSYGFIQ